MRVSQRLARRVVPLLLPLHWLPQRPLRLLRRLRLLPLLLLPLPSPSLLVASSSVRLPPSPPFSTTN